MDEYAALARHVAALQEKQTKLSAFISFDASPSLRHQSLPPHLTRQNSRPFGRSQIARISMKRSLLFRVIVHDLGVGKWPPWAGQP